MTSLTLLKENRCHGGWQRQFTHESSSTACSMRLSVFLPEQALSGPVPVLYFLSGLTCTDENFSMKSGAQRYAAEHGLALVMPDTSPRGVSLPGEDESWDFGSGAGYYVDATEQPWSRHYRMHSYVAEELPALLGAELPLDHCRAGIFGHSVGGHGALLLGLKKPELFRSISAFAPLTAAATSDWGKKAFRQYLGDDESRWVDFDATQLILKKRDARPILVDQGGADEFLPQLRPELLEEACKKAGTPLTLRRREGYDHSYYFVASFVGEHIAWHAEKLKAL